jgi:hypothetical protein
VARLAVEYAFVVEVAFGTETLRGAVGERSRPEETYPVASEQQGFPWHRAHVAASVAGGQRAFAEEAAVVEADYLDSEPTDWWASFRRRDGVPVEAEVVGAVEMRVAAGMAAVVVEDDRQHQHTSYTCC